ncbi:hypothetical protein ACPMJQ_32385 [Streptomyces pseudogriseolus]|uniref:Uncharacterized protein n=2 Tax=unclassified Streptomyces TaxID=2593676 RepID=A0AB39NY15_9ACTN
MEPARMLGIGFLGLVLALGVTAGSALQSADRPPTAASSALNGGLSTDGDSGWGRVRNTS